MIDTELYEVKNDHKTANENILPFASLMKLHINFENFISRRVNQNRRNFKYLCGI